VADRRDAALRRGVSEVMLPLAGSGGGAPRPRNPSALAVRMVKPMPMEVRTMIGDMTLGSTCNSTMRHVGTPSAMAASMKVSFFRERTSAWTRRADHGQYLTPNA